MAADMPLPQATTFRSLVDDNSERLFRIAYRMTGNRDDADDVVQDTFLASGSEEAVDYLMELIDG